MKKKIVCALITSAMVLSLAGCGSASSTASKAADAASKAVSTAEEAVSEAASTVEEAASEAASAAEEVVSAAEEAVSEAASAVEEVVSEAASAAEKVESAVESAAAEAESEESAAAGAESEAESAASEAESAVSEAASAASEAESAVSEAASAASEAESAVSEAASAASEAESKEAEAEDSDVAYIMEKGSLIVGITDFAPMDFKDDSGNWIGFDADLAALVAADLGVDVEFVEIDWDNKILELNNKSIDCVWNGMTLTDEVKNSMETTNAYCNNAQVVVLPADKAEDYKDVESLKDLKFAVEAGSAGEAAAKENGFDYTSLTAQADTLLEVKSGTSDASIIDLLMADAMIGEGTSYPDLTHTVELTAEEYGIGCRKGSDLAEFINEELKALYEDGTLEEIAETYDVAAAVIEQK